MSPPGRFRAIDVMRGLTLALMIIVNMSISDEKSYAPLLHAVWHGLTLTDLVFPTFLFVVGASMSFTLPRMQSLSEVEFLVKVFRRSALIFLCGILLGAFPFVVRDVDGDWMSLSFNQIRILGVLQRIALCYALACLILHYWKPRGAMVFSVVALLGAWLIHVGFGDNSLQGSAALKVDLWLLGESHMYRGEGVPFDPEGVLGTLPSIVSVLAGCLSGNILRKRPEELGSLLKMIASGCVLVCLGWIWGHWLPINKKIWTGSYAVVCIGVDLVLLALLVWLLDVIRCRRGAYFFEVFGKNTLFIYLLAEMLMSTLWLIQFESRPLFDWIYAYGFQSWLSDKMGSLVFAVLFMLLCWTIGYAMDKQKIYIKL